MDNKDLANLEISDRREKEIGRAVQNALEEIEKAAKGRDVKLVAATKTRDAGEIMAAIRAGVRAIGENRVQEMEVKAPIIKEKCEAEGIEVSLHLIGQLQKNKIGKALAFADCIESVESLAKAEEISKRLASGKEESVFLEVNESGEEEKNGCSPEEARDLAIGISRISGLKLVGLMTVASKESAAGCFSRLKNLRDQIFKSVESCQRLSMGMSSDFREAIKFGATDVRLGSAIFGPRSFK